MRRVRSAVLVAGLVALAACGDGGSILDAGNDEQQASTVPASTAPVSTRPGDTTTMAPTTVPPTTTTTPLDSLPACPTDALASAAGPIEITFWHGMNAANQDALIALTDAYNASQTKVHVTLQNQGGYEATVDKYLQSDQKNRPDLVQFPEYMVRTIIDTHSTIPAGACIRSDGYDTSKLLPRALDYYATEGVQWSMPFNVSNPVLFYNKAVWTKAGLDPEQPPLSLEDVRAQSRQIVDSGAAKYGIAVDSDFDGGGGWYIEQWFGKLGQFYADNENGRIAPAAKVLFDGPVGVQLMTELQSLVRDGLAVNVGDNASGQDGLLKLADPNEPAAMNIATSAALGTVLSVVDGGLIPGITSDQIGVGPMPGPGTGKGALIGGASLWVVDGKGDAQAAATWDFVKFLVSAESQSKWAVATGYVPINADAPGLDPLKTTYANDPRFKVAYDQVAASSDDPSQKGPIIGPLREVRVVTARAVAAILNGADPQASLSDAAAQANALIADYTARAGG